MQEQVSTFTYVSFLTRLKTVAPYIHNPDENPCHACAPVMVNSADHEHHSTAILMGWPIRWAQGMLTLCSQTHVP